MAIHGLFPSVTLLGRERTTSSCDEQRSGEEAGGNAYHFNPKRRSDARRCFCKSLPPIVPSGLHSRKARSWLTKLLNQGGKTEIEDGL